MRLAEKHDPTMLSDILVAQVCLARHACMCMSHAYRCIYDMQVGTCGAVRTCSPPTPTRAPSSPSYPSPHPSPPTPPSPAPPPLLSLSQARAAAERKQFLPAEGLLIKAKRPEAALKMYRDARMWNDALRVAEQYLPNKASCGRKGA